MKKPKFQAFYKDFNTGELKFFDALSFLWDEMLTKNGKLRKSVEVLDKGPVRDKATLKLYLMGEFMYRYWSRCEYEVIVVAWPYRDRVEDSEPRKVDVFWQLSANIDVIVDLVWNYIEPKITKS